MSQPTFSLITGGLSRAAADQSSYTTASLAPSANKLVVACFVSDRSSGTTNQPTLADGQAGVAEWDVFDSEVNIQGTRRSTWFYGLSGPSPGSGTATFDLAGQTQQYGCWGFAEIDLVKLTGTNGADGLVQGNSSGSGTNTTTPSVTLANAYGHADNLALAFIHCNTSGITITAGSNYNILSQMASGGTPGGSIALMYGRDSDLVVDATLSGGTTVLMHAIEIAGFQSLVVPIIQRNAFATRRFNGRMRS